jgi:hypothetical protein
MSLQNHNNVLYSSTDTVIQVAGTNASRSVQVVASATCINTSPNAAPARQGTKHMKRTYETTPRSNDAESTKDTKGNTLRKLIAIGALSTIALTGCATNNAEAKDDKATTQETEAPKPEKEIAPAEAWGGIEPGLEGEALTKAFEIPAGLSDEALAQTFIDKINAWNMYGASDKLADDYFNNTSIGSDEFEAGLEKQAAATSEAVVAALFDEGAFTHMNSMAQQLVDFQTSVNAHSANFYVLTSKAAGNAEDLEPYRRFDEITQVEVQDPEKVDPTARLLEITFLEKSNTDKNHADDLGATETDPKGAETHYKVGFTTVDGTEKITFIRYW